MESETQNTVMAYVKLAFSSLAVGWF